MCGISGLIELLCKNNHTTVQQQRMKKMNGMMESISSLSQGGQEESQISLTQIGVPSLEVTPYGLMKMMMMMMIVNDEDDDDDYIPYSSLF